MMLIEFKIKNFHFYWCNGNHYFPTRKEGYVNKAIGLVLFNKWRWHTSDKKWRKLHDIL